MKVSVEFFFPGRLTANAYNCVLMRITAEDIILC